MPVRKTLVCANLGVRLERIEVLSARGKVRTQHYLLQTLRCPQPRLLMDTVTAEEAFDLEVLAALSDPEVLRKALD